MCGDRLEDISPFTWPGHMWPLTHAGKAFFDNPRLKAFASINRHVEFLVVPGRDYNRAIVEVAQRLKSHLVVMG